MNEEAKPDHFRVRYQRIRAKLADMPGFQLRYVSARTRDHNSCILSCTCLKKLRDIFEREDDK